MLKILLTGEPGVGKSTLLSKILPSIQLPARGIVAEEMRSDDGFIRLGFKARQIHEPRAEKVFAHMHDIDSQIELGPYKVDVSVFDTFVSESLKPFPDGVVVADEIGRMQYLSESFRQSVETLLGLSNQLVLATIVYDPEPWSRGIKQHPAAILIRVNPENRDLLARPIGALINNSRLLSDLSPNQTGVFIQESRDLLARGSFLEFEKLVDNALTYLAQDRVRNVDAGTIEVKGFHGSHTVTFSEHTFGCDCRMFRGEEPYQSPAECSHIKAARIHMQP